MIRHRGRTSCLVGLVIRVPDRVAVIDSVKWADSYWWIAQFLVPLARVVAPRPKKLHIVFEFSQC